MTRYTYRPDNLRHRKETGRSRATHYWDGQSIVLEINANGFVKAVYLRGVTLVAQGIGEDTYYYLFNAHGDVVQKVSNNGDSTPMYQYDAFGNQRDINDDDPNPFRYCGEYFEKETQEIYLRNRYYDTRTGRFGVEDRARDGGNWYGYAANNPGRFKDPRGLRIVEDIYDRPSSENESRGLPYALRVVIELVEKVRYELEQNSKNVYKNLPVYKQSDWSSNGFTVEFASYACYATSVLAIAQFYGYDITMVDLVINGNVESHNAWVHNTTPYFTTEAAARHTTPDIYGPIIREELENGNPVIVSLTSNGNDHYVVAVQVIDDGTRNDQIIVMDPATGSHETLQFVLDKGYRYFGLRTTRKGNE